MRYALVVFCFLSVGARAQALRDVNYNFLYDPTEPFTLKHQSRSVDVRVDRTL